MIEEKKEGGWAARVVQQFVPAYWFFLCFSYDFSFGNLVFR